MNLQKAETPKFTPFTLTIENEQELRLLAILVGNSGASGSPRSWTPFARCVGAINIALWKDMCREYGNEYIFNLSLAANGCHNNGIDFNKF